MADAPDRTEEVVEEEQEVSEVSADAPADAPAEAASGPPAAASAEPPPAFDGRETVPEEEHSPPSGGGEQAAGEQAAADGPDWEDIAKRKAAELENFRRQAAQRVQKAGRDGMKRVAAEILPALDDFERALAHAEAQEGDDEHQLTRGIRLVQEQMLAALRRAGIEPYSPKGEPFDPHLHEAVAQQPTPDGAQSGTVIEVYQAGYRLGDDVLRPARVVVAG